MCVQAAHNYIVNMIFGNGATKRSIYFDALDKYKRKIMKENRYTTIYSCITFDSMLIAPGICRRGVMKSENETEGRSWLKVEKTKHAMPLYKSTVNMPLNFAFHGKWKQTMVLFCAFASSFAAVVGFFPSYTIPMGVFALWYVFTSHRRYPGQAADPVNSKGISRCDANENRKKKIKPTKKRVTATNGKDIAGKYRLNQAKDIGFHSKIIRIFSHVSFFSHNTISLSLLRRTQFV